MKLIALLVGLIVLVSCGHVKDAARAGAHDAIDCASSEVLKVEKEYGPSFELLLQHSTSDTGSIDLPTLDTASKNLDDIKWCVVEKTFTRAIAAVAKAIDRGSSPLSTTPEQLKGALEALRAQQHRPAYTNTEPSS